MRFKELRQECNCNQWGTGIYEYGDCPPYFTSGSGFIKAIVLDMNINEILGKIDELNRESRLAEAEEYMLKVLDLATQENDWETALTVLNELAGHYRDRGIHEKALDACMQSEKLLDENGIGNTKERGAAYLNTANVYRAKGEYEASLSYYERAKAIIEKSGDSYLASSYYNNLALLYQELERFDTASECLRSALEIVERDMQDELRLAISKTNLAVSLISMGAIDEPETLLMAAFNIFEGRTPSDFHYSAALAAAGDLRMLKGDKIAAAEYYEMALSEIELHMGKNEFYSRVEEKLMVAYGGEAVQRQMKGLDICERYFKAFAEPVLRKSFGDILEYIACGMWGEGSECLGFDDAASRDHDFGPAFVIAVSDSVSDEAFKRLEAMYNNLPKCYMGLSRVNTREGIGRVGVMRIEKILEKATGFDHVPKGIEEWQSCVDENLVLITNGRVFLDEGCFFADIRRHIKFDQPYFVYFNKLAMNLELMAKHGQYGYKRALSRQDAAAALIAKAEFVKAVMRAAHLLSRKYAPYDKWLFKSFKELVKNKRGMGKCYEKILPQLENIVQRGVCEEDIASMENICSVINALLIDCGLCHGSEEYLLAKAYEIKELAKKSIIADSIIDIEWKLFDRTKNDGGRANCQDDWGTFSIMRRSQYYVWPPELLKTLLADYSEAAQNGRNIITEKYGFMMESTAPEEFARIKDKLPAVPADKRALIDAIAAIQVGFMEEFAREYPGISDNARVIHTYEDTAFDTSYETYLRGELSTYHDDTLSLYGRFIAELAANGMNLAKMIISMTTFFYGYSSLTRD